MFRKSRLRTTFLFSAACLWASTGILGAATVFAAAESPSASIADPQSLPRLESDRKDARKRPNVIYIVLDDVGFADLGAYGSEIKTPHIDALASQGLRFNNFQTRSLCSPTRAALLTGRNSHSVGVANASNLVSGYPNGQGRITASAATIAELLRKGGYRTFAVGKWHLSPTTISSDRDYWPVGKGFEQFYGFIGSMTSQYEPDLVADNTPISFSPPADYHLSTDLVDHAISNVASAVSDEPDKPFFLYLSFGAMHAPHHAPASYRQLYENTYDIGWDEIRQRRLARQKELHIAPAGAELAPRNPGVKPWAELSPQEQLLNIAYQANYAGFLTHTDAQIGRLIEFLKRSRQFDNTVIVLLSDNGGSREGRQNGSLNAISSMNERAQSTEEDVKRIAEIGTRTTWPNYPMGWTQASNTPFMQYKSTALDGGTRTPLIIYAPQEVKDRGGVRGQFVDVTDITPTILDISHTPVGDTFKGEPQLAMAGVSIRGVLKDETLVSPHPTQYFELLGNRAIWHAGWKAIANHDPAVAFENQTWRLYDTRTDFSGLHDLAGEYPQKLEELKALWWLEAGKYGVLPLLRVSLLESFSVAGGANRPGIYKVVRDSRPEYVLYPEAAATAPGEGPKLGIGSYAIEAEFNAMTGLEQGVIVADGDRFGGYTLYIRDQRLVFEFSDAGSMSVVTATQPLAAETKAVSLRFTRRSPIGGEASLYYDGKRVGTGWVGSIPTKLTTRSTFSIGRDEGGRVSDNYQDDGAFPISADTLRRVTVRNLAGE